MVKKNLIIFTVIIIILVMVGIFFFTMRGDLEEDLIDQQEQFSQEQIQQETEEFGEELLEESPQDSGVEPQTHNIEIKEFKFIPETLTIKQGDTIIWTNKDSARHTVTSDSGGELDSELLSKEESYSHTFNTKGEFAYHCTPHPYMEGKIIVK